MDLPGAPWHVALNAGMARAVGDVVAFTSCDDVMDVRAVEHHVDALMADPAAGYSAGRVILFADDAGMSHSVPVGLPGTDRWARILETIAVRRSVLDTVGGFREELEHSADVEWVARLGDLAIPVVEVDAVVVSKRLHTGNTTYSGEGVDTGITRSLRISILRKQGRA